MTLRKLLIGFLCYFADTGFLGIDKVDRNPLSAPVTKKSNSYFYLDFKTVNLRCQVVFIRVLH